MPSIATDSHYRSTAASSPSNSFDLPQRKSYDKVSVGNTFLYTPGLNGDSVHLEPHALSQQSDHNQLVTDLKNGSAHSMNGARSSVSSYSRDRGYPKDDQNDSSQSLGSGRSARESKDQPPPPPPPPQQQQSGQGSAMVDGPATGSGEGTASPSTVPQVNGVSSHSSSPKPTANGDTHQPSTTDDRGLSEVNASSSPANLPASTSLPDHTSHQPQESDRLAPPKRPGHRYSSPPAPSNVDGAGQSSLSSRQSQRHTLQVPKPAPGRKNSRELSDDTHAYSSGRLSPTGGHLRRGSLSLVRRATRTGAAEHHPDDALADEDAARWAEAIKQKRARKKRREEEDDDRVIVGTKVDQNHVNWVTAYNMLTGIRFVVSRINAKMDRELTPADFEAKHKFSFDV